MIEENWELFALKPTTTITVTDTVNMCSVGLVLLHVSLLPTTFHHYKSNYHKTPPEVHGLPVQRSSSDVAEFIGFFRLRVPFSSLYKTSLKYSPDSLVCGSWCLDFCVGGSSRPSDTFVYVLPGVEYVFMAFTKLIYLYYTPDRLIVYGSWCLNFMWIGVAAAAHQVHLCAT